MRNRDKAVLSVLLIVTALAVGGATMLVASGRLDLYVASGSIALLALVQIAVVVFVLPRLSDHAEAIAATNGLVGSLFAKSDVYETRLAQLEQQLAGFQAAPADSKLLDELRSLRDSVKGLMQDIVQPAAAHAPVKPVVREAPRFTAAPAAKPPAEEPAAATAPLPEREQLDFLLEPVIELTTGATMHYRAQVAMTGAGGTVDFATLLERADAGGMRPALELHLLRQALPVLRRLRIRHPNLRLLVPIGAATLNSTADLSTLIAALEIEHDVTGGIVFDLRQSDIARLRGDGISGLAQLGRAGAVMALSDVDAAGLDLPALRQLGVRYLIIDAGSFEPGFGASPAWKQFAQFARAMQFQIIAGNVSTAQQASAATRVARFGSGSFFAPPRKVKSDAGNAVPAWHERAA